METDSVMMWRQKCHNLSETKNIRNYPENAFTGINEEVLALAMTENMTVRWFELKDKKLQLCSHVIASMF